MTVKVNVRNSAYIKGLNISQGKGDLQGWKLGEAMDDLASASGNIANQIASNPSGTDVVPPNVAQLKVQHWGAGQIEFQITDNSPVQRAIDYVVEAADNPQFQNSHIVHVSPSRNGTVIRPNGNWWFKAYSQYRFGGPPSSPIVAAPVTVTGGQNAAIYPTQGAGTNSGSTNQGVGLKISR